MEDGDGVLSFDFEGTLDTTIPNPNPNPNPNPIASIPNPPSTTAPALSSSSAAADVGGGGQGQRRSFRQTVCRHWLRSLCMKGDACGFLHQYDKARMPICRFFVMYGECREQDCVYKHTNEGIKECNMYKLGFCPNGPDCRYRHAKLPGPPPPVEEVLQKIQQLTSYNYGGSNRFYQQRGQNYSQQGAQLQQNGNPASQLKPSTMDSSNIEPQGQNEQQLQQTSHTQLQKIATDVPNSTTRTATPLPQGVTRYFIVKSCNHENLELSVQQGVWATQRSNEAKLNEAFDSADHVILIFSINRTRHFQGCAKMTSKIGESVVGGNWKHAHGTAHYGRNFSVKWLKLSELSFHKTRHLRNPYNENLPVKISRDCQELEPAIGEQLASLLYLEPDSELTATLVAAEQKREEEKTKGVDVDNGAGNPDIVLFDDNEEEEEEESDEEEDSSVQVPRFLAQGRGRGRGMMWPPNMGMARGMRPMPGMRGFQPGMMGVDGFGHGVGPDGFPMADPFGMGPRPFMPYGPRFPGDFSAAGPGMMFPNRPPQPGGFGMMMGPGRPPFMGGMGPQGPGRPGGRPVAPFYPPPSQNMNRPLKRDQRASGNEWSDSFGPDQSKGQDSAGFAGGRRDDEAHYQQNPKGPVDKFVVGNNLRNEDSDSEEEAPRRSRHGEGKKKRTESDQ
ncbi:hypothetical protein Droror1_Dr00018369 [Drosera rotundifolia]